MTSQVRVHIRSVQKSGGTADINHTETEGRLTVSPDRRFLLRFDTTDDSGTVSTTVRSTDGQRITVKRLGSVKTEMVFDTVSPTPFLYTTPFGSFGFMIRTDEISLIAAEEPAISLVMRYTLFNGGEPVSENTIDIKTEL